MNLDSGSKLLIDEPPIVAQPSLICAVGLDRAIIVQRLHFLLQQKYSGTILDDGEKYVWNTYEDFHRDHFPWWSPETIRKHLKALENEGFVIAKKPYSKSRNQTKHYRLNYDKLNEKLCELYLKEKVEEHQNPTEKVSDLDAVKNSESNRKIFRMEPEISTASQPEISTGSLKEQRIQQRVQNTQNARIGNFSAAEDFPQDENPDFDVGGISSAQTEFEQKIWHGLEERRFDSPFENPIWEEAMRYAYQRNFTAEEFLGCLDDCRSWENRKGRVTPAIVTNNLADYVLRKGRVRNAHGNGDGGEYVNPMTGKGLK